MITKTTLNPILSFPEVVQSRKPREMFESRLIKLLRTRLKELKIIWSSEAFRGGLNNPELPAYLLKKLESLIVLAESLDWKLSKTLKDEFDITVEDIETFNPPFRKMLERASKEIEKGNFMTHEEFIKSLNS
jgi:hypothetical protein